MKNLEAFEQLDRSAPRKGSYKSVYLGYPSNNYQITISEEAYNELIVPLQRYSVCHECRQYYDQEKNPNVAGNLCLSCFLRLHSDLTYQGPLDAAADAERREYFFLDAWGIVHTTKAGPGQSESAQEDKRATAHYWHFPLPEEAEHNGEKLSLQRCACILYGDLRHGEVLLVNFVEYRPDIDVTFLVKRNGPAIQINKRREEHRRLLREARAELTATKQPNGKYLINGQERSQIAESDIYRLIVAQINGELVAKPEQEAQAHHEQPGGDDNEAPTTP